MPNPDPLTKDPLTKLEHRWVGIEMTPMDVFCLPSGEVVAEENPNETTEVQLGCAYCDATPEEGWYTVCPGEGE